MSWFSKIKQKVEGDLAKGSESTPGRVGQAIGRGIAAVGGRVKEKYNRKYGGGEYREARIKETTARAKEFNARAKLAKAKRAYKENKSNAFKAAFGIEGRKTPQDYSYLTGDKKRKGDYSFITGK